MKKTLAMLIALCMMLTMLAGCSAADGENSIDYNATALKIGDLEYSIADFNYMMVMNFSSFYNYYGSAMSEYIDLTTTLTEQDNGEGTDWDTYFKDYTVMTLQDLTSLYMHAVEEGVELSDDDKEYIDSIATSLQEEAEEYGTDVQTYINDVYGPGVTYTTIKKMIEIRYLAATYVEQYQENLTMTEEEAMEYYENDKNSYDTVDFRFYYIDYSTDTDAEDYLSAEQAKERAESFRNVTTEEEFINLCAEYADEDEKEYYLTEDGMSLYTDAEASDLGTDDLSDWLFDEDRKLGDFYIQDEPDYLDIAVIMFVRRNSQNYNLRTVRHILVTPEADESGIYTDEAWEEALDKAEDIYEEYKKDERETNFMTLAEKYSEDSGSNTDGGIYENVYKGRMVEEFEDWLFDEERQPGDTGIIKTSYGYHVMYYVGEGDNNIKVNLVEDILDNIYDEWINGISAELTAEKTDAYQYCGDIIHEIYNKAMEHIAASETESADDTETADSSSETSQEQSE